jgi:hypothetical protein
MNYREFFVGDDLMSATLQQAITQIKAGHKKQGKALLIKVLKAEPENDRAWVWMTAVVDSDELRQKCLEEALKFNPNNETAQKALIKLRQKQMRIMQPEEVEPVPPQQQAKETWSYAEHMKTHHPETISDQQTGATPKDKLEWYEWAWSGLPIFLLFMGGAIGGALAGGAIVGNGQIFRSNMPGIFKYMITFGISVGAYILYFFLAGLLSTLF